MLCNEKLFIYDRHSDILGNICDLLCIDNYHHMCILDSIGMILFGLFRNYNHNENSSKLWKWYQKNDVILKFAYDKFWIDLNDNILNDGQLFVKIKSAKLLYEWPIIKANIWSNSFGPNNVILNTLVTHHWGQFRRNIIYHNWSKLNLTLIFQEIQTRDFPFHWPKCKIFQFFF